MKKEELMVGDLVKIGSNVCKIEGIFSINGYPYVAEFTLAGRFNESTSKIDLEYVKPIPLTEEILEKNGYKYQDWWYEQEGYPDITNIFSDDMYEIGKHTYYGKGQPEFSSIIKIRYVHELQHALKLCNIEKEILI